MYGSGGMLGTDTYSANIDLTYTINGGTSGSGGTTDPKAPRKPNANEVQDFGHGSPKSAVKLICDDVAAHSCSFKKIRDNVVQDTGYSFGSVIKNDDTYDGVPSSQYPWMCEMTVYAGPFLSEYNGHSSFGGKYGTHYLVKNKPDTVKVMWFYGTDGSWYYDNTNVPVEFHITCDTTPEPKLPTKDDLDKIPLEDFWVAVTCTKDYIQHPTLKIKLSEGKYTIADKVEGDAQSGYTCKVTVYADEYVD